ncbi:MULTISPECIES: elongation factor P [Aminobacterium]|jgi:elongation factor P|uniref:Elongation factor P n=1 Tax=Aminobacterium colombiense (strain DSM 12261 / ALA-1) TaxID=572547 RepID=D5EF30_AMICL|nr:MULTISPECIES: elongation factor P [Aminobacterium]MDD2378363.1 elongation factor P [Aminobacterium colombiense]ADE57162.1 translation elongation factor P [Aminobacterium colombiense DSM 12261]MDD3767218.1 elongation factor P [Aminobacterium colombiense]MDD4264826.1 elongation factor P [Aminobacterium colombiense]MDD4585051.1 elongation factor P [Aminobacterium colombiense]
MSQVIDTSDFYSGIKVKWQDGIWEIIDYQHHKMGRGGAVIRTKLRNVETGSSVETTFRSGEKFERVIYDEKAAQFLYQEGDSYVFMDMGTYDQLYIHKDVLGDAINYLTDNLEVQIEYFEERVMGIDLPKSVELQVIDTPPGYKGDTVSSGGKPATLETGITITVPIFINIGDTVVVDTRSGEYLERAKK